MNARLIKILILMLFCNWAFGQDDNKQIDDLLDLSIEQLLNVEVTTATKTKSKLDMAPSIVEVITGDQIIQTGYQNLGQLLNDICNNHSDRSNWGIGEPLNQNVGFGFRFDTGQNMLLLFNGQRLNALLPGNRFGGEEYLLKNIERIEIIRGPGSAIYGTGAFTSVINIISKRVADVSQESIQLGSQYIPTSKGYAFNGSMQSLIGKQGSLSGAFRYSSEQGQQLLVHNALFGDQKLKDGINHALDGEIVYSNGNFNLFSKLSDQQRKTFTGFNGVNTSNEKDLTLSMHAYSIGSNYTFNITPKTSIKLSGGWHKDNWTEVAFIPQFKLTPAGDDLLLDANGLPILDTLTLYRNGEVIQTSFFIDGQGADTQSLDGEIQFTYNFHKTNNIVLGVYVADDRVLKAYRPSELNLDPLEFVPFRVITDDKNNWLFDTRASRQTLAYYAQFDYNFTDKLVVTGGARLDEYSGKGILKAQKYNEFNPRVGLVYAMNKTNTFKLLYGQATRIPNGFETLSAVAILGDPQNRPERMKTFQFELISNWSNNFRTEIGAFHANISNRLVTNADIAGLMKAQGFIGQFVNTTSPENQSSNGIDGKINYRVKKINFLLNFTKYIRTNDGYGEAIPYIPTTMINGDIKMPLGWLNICAGFNYRNKFTKLASDPRDPVKSYMIGRLNIIASPPQLPIDFSLTCRNLLNTQYQYPSSSLDFYQNFPARKLELALSVNYKFN